MATVTAGSPHRAKAWARPPKLRFPQPIEAGVARLETAWRARTGPLYRTLCDAAPLIEPGGSVRDRTRRMRAEGVRNLLTLCQALLANADLASGFLGAPTTEGPWTRHSEERIDHRAFGSRVPHERSMRRTERWLRHLGQLNLIVIRQIPIPTPQGIRSEIAVKKLSSAFYALLGLTSAVKAARRARERERGEQRIAQLLTGLDRGERRRPRRRFEPKEAPTKTPQTRGGAPPRRSDAGPLSPTAVSAITALKTLLGED